MASLLSGEIAAPAAVSGALSPEEHAAPKLPTPKAPTLDLQDFPFTHFEPNLRKIGDVVWRQRSHVLGQVVSILSSNDGSPKAEIEIWDETGGITLQFIGRQRILGIKVGTYLKAEGMVGEVDGNLTIMNPRYEIVH